MSSELSIVVPIYNWDMYLSRCIDSLLQQEHSEIKLLLVDEGPSDSSGCYCDQYAEKDNHVHVFQKPNAGVSAAENVLIVQEK